MAKITEIGTDEVKFKIFGQQDGPVITMKREDIKIASVGGQKIINVKMDPASQNEDLIVKKSGDQLKVKVIEIGTEEIKFKLFTDPDGPMISMLRSDIKTMKVDGQTVIDVKTGLSEDIIVKKDGSVIKAKISEMGASEVKYKLYTSPDGPLMSLRKQDIESVKIDGQVVYEHKPDPYSVSNNSILDRTSTVKFYFFSPLNHHIDFGYEWMNKPGFNWDMALGIIGPGVSSNPNRVPKGIFLRGGPKFLLGSSSDVVTEDTKDRYAHPLKGRFIKVEVILNAFSTTNKIDTTNYWSPSGITGHILYKKKYQSVTIDLQYGRQYIFGNAMTLAWYLGVGYSFENETSNLDPAYKAFDYFNISRYSHTYFGETFPMIFTWGVTIGYILPAPKWMVSKKVTYNKAPTRHSMND
ncbi:MAG: hypothetical protein EPN85_12085 [Bacteroidetes bacterium]|nr:MAG: hypothetical protein EPN85_12085 [Bacteroidota bacterium]